MRGLRPSVATLLGLATLAVVFATPLVILAPHRKPTPPPHIPKSRNRPEITSAVSREVTVLRKLSGKKSSGGPVKKERTAPKTTSSPATDAVSREVSLFSASATRGATDAVSREVSLFSVSGLNTATDAVSREVTLFAASASTSPNDAVSREITIGRGLEPSPATDAVSRELTLFRQVPIATATDAVSRETTLVFRKRVRVNDAVSRELTFFTKTSESVIPTDAVSREFTLDAPVPDLLVSSASAPAEIWTDTSFTIQWSDRNRGKGSARGPWIDRVWLSEDNQPGNDRILTDFPFGDVIKPGTTTTRRGEVTIPKAWLSADVEDKWLIFTADLNDNVFERGNENNNWYALKIRVKKSPIPDLIIKPGSLVIPATASSEQEIQAKFIVKNVGTASTDASEWADWVHLSPDDTPHSNEIVRVSSTNIAYLDPGQEYAATVTFKIPRGTFGNYKVVAFADGDADLGVNAVKESNETNNTASAPIKITIAPYPDFQTSNVSGPVSAPAGGIIDVSWKVTNKGTGNVPLQDRVWSDRVYLSKDDKLDASDIRLNSRAQTGNVAKDKSYSVQNYPVQIPKGIRDLYYLIVQADDANNVYEFVYEGNNWAVSSRQINIVDNAADFVVTDLKVPPKANGADSVDVEWTVKNQGLDSDIGPWVDTVYMSKDATLDSGDTAMGDFFQGGPLKANESYSEKEKVRIPDCEDGDRWFFVVTDRSNRINEYEGETNNTSTAQPMKVSANAPNLQVTSLVVPRTATTNQPLGITWTVTNSGVGSTRQPAWTDTIMLSRDLNGLIEPRVLGSFIHSGVLEAGKSYKQSQSVVMPADLYGTYYVTVFTDFGNVVPECENESDNYKRSGQLKITSKLPNLVGPVVGADPKWKIGTSVSVQWTGKNAGPADLPLTFWRDQVWLSRDKFLNSGDVPLGSCDLFRAVTNGSTYPAASTFNVPLIAAGDWYILVQADSLGQIYEGANEGDNVSEAKIVRVDPPDVDLTVTQVDAPDSAVAGQAMTVNWTVTNAGTESTQVERWLDRVYLSKDKVLDPTDLAMGWVIRPKGLAGGESYGASSTFEVPTGLSGPYYALVLTDVSNEVFERTPDGELNNLGVDPGVVQIKLPPPVDLVVDSITPPSTAELGERISIPFRVKNSGTQAAFGEWMDAVYLSTDKTWSSDDELLGRVAHAGGLPARGTYSSNWEGDLPGVEPGKYYVIVRTDVRNKVRESDEKNNARNSLTQLTATVKTIPSGVWSDTQLDFLRTKYVRTATKAGDTLQWDIQDSLPDAWNDLFAKVNKVARPFNYEARSDAFVANASATLPETADGHAYATFTRVGPNSNGNGGKIRPMVIPFGLTDVSPRLVGNIGQVSFVLKGGRLKDLKSARLVGVLKTVDAAEIEVQDGANAVARFMFDGLPVGTYNLEVTSSAGVVSTFAGVTVELGAKVGLETLTSAPSAFPRGLGRGTYVQTSNIVNIGNVDAPVVMVQVGVPYPDLKISVDRSTRTFPALLDGMIPAIVSKAGNQTIHTFFLANLPVGTSETFRISTPIPFSTPEGPMRVVVRATAFSAKAFQAMVLDMAEVTRLKLVSSGLALTDALQNLVSDKNAWAQYFLNTAIQNLILPKLTSWQDIDSSEGGRFRAEGILDSICRAACWAKFGAESFLLADATIACLTGLAPTGLGAVICWVGFISAESFLLADFTCCLIGCDHDEPPRCGVSSVLCNIFSYKSAYDVLTTNLKDFIFPYTLFQAIVTYTNYTDVCITHGVDPNDLIGPNSSGDAAYVSSSHPWTYRTRFENQATAQAAANRIHVESTLPDALDRKTTKIAAVGLGGQTITLGDGAFVSQRKRLTLNGKDLDVFFSGGIDVRTGKVSMDIEAIDPETGEPPESALVGLLSPEDGTGRGNGYFEFSVNPIASLPTGTKIKVQAAIQFDDEPVMATNVVTNTVEADLPTSQIDALPTESTSETITLTYKASDPTAGLDGVDIWCRVDDGAYTKVAGMVRTGTQTFTGTKGHTYRFYSIAIDKVGNAELPPTTPDAVVTIK